MKRKDVKIGMKVVPFKKSLVYDVGIIQTKKAKKNLEESSQWEEAKKIGQPFLYVKEIMEEEGFEFICLGVRRYKPAADFFLPRDFRPYEGK